MFVRRALKNYYEKSTVFIMIFSSIPKIAHGTEPPLQFFIRIITCTVYRLAKFFTIFEHAEVRNTLTENMMLPEDYAIVRSGLEIGLNRRIETTDQGDLRFMVAESGRRFFEMFKRYPGSRDVAAIHENLAWRIYK